MKKIIAILTVAGSIFLLFLWAPWVTDEYAVRKVVEKLGGPGASFDYLGVDIPIQDIPKHVNWYPFGRFVSFPGEAGWVVTLFGGVY